MQFPAQLTKTNLTAILTVQILHSNGVEVTNGKAAAFKTDNDDIRTSSGGNSSQLVPFTGKTIFPINVGFLDIESMVNFTVKWIDPKNGSIYTANPNQNMQADVNIGSASMPIVLTLNKKC